MKISKFTLLSLLSVLIITSCNPFNSSSELSSETTILSEIPSSSEPPVSVSVTERYSITFYSEGGTSVNKITAEAGDTITKPSDPIRQGYRFIDWYEDKGTWANAFVFDVMPERDVVLYAKWDAIAMSEIDAYNADLALRSKPNHLYIHYLRFENTVNEYAKWDIWVWPDKKTGRIFDFVKDGNDIYTDIYGGAMIEVDLGYTYTDGGHDGSGNKTNAEVSFSVNEVVVERIGFLITYKQSRTSGAHWTSDGGDKFLLTAEAMAFSLNDSLHVFAVQENTRNFTYNYTGEEFQNPYETDDGNNVSSIYNDVDSSGVQAPISASSPLFKQKGVGYQIMVASFADSDGDGMGDIRGIINSLTYLKNLNVEVLWLTPVQLSDSYHGYDTIDYYNIDPKFGSKTSPHAVNGVVTTASANNDYLELLSAADALGMSVVMDLVLNHTSINNLLFQESLSLDPEYRAYYHWRNTKPNANWYQYSNYEYYYYGKFASSMPEFNFDYQKTRDKIVDIMTHWVNRGVSGFRIDAVKHVYMKEEVTPAAGDKIITDGGNSEYDSNLTKNLHFFKELNKRLKEVNPNVFIVGENFDGHAYHVAPYYEGLDGMLNFYMYYNLTEATVLGQKQDTPLTGTKLSGAKILGNDNFSEAGLQYGGNWNYNDTFKAYNRYRSGGSLTSGSAIDNNFTSNHDINRAINQANGNNISASNKALAEKQVLTYMAASLLLPGVSWIYYGDELGLTSNMPAGSNKDTPNIDRIFRQPMKWDKTGADTRTTAYSFSGGQTYDVAWDAYNLTLDGVVEQSADNNSLLSKVKQITALKATIPALKSGDFAPIDMSRYNNLDRVFAFSRTLGTEKYEVYINFSKWQNLNIKNVTGTVLLSFEGATMTNFYPWSVLVVKV